MDDVKQDLMRDLEGAAKMLSQALNRVHPSLDIHKAIREVDSSLDDLRSSLEEGDYEIEGR